MTLQESGEMYLETIKILKAQKPHVKAVDIVEELGYSKSSVSRAVNLLKENGYITVAADGNIDFTENGNTRAGEVYERHLTLTSYLEKLGVSPETAEGDACRIEHVISSETFDAIKRELEQNRNK